MHWTDILNAKALRFVMPVFLVTISGTHTSCVLNKNALKISSQELLNQCIWWNKFVKMEKTYCIKTDNSSPTLSQGLFVVLQNYTMWYISNDKKFPINVFVINGNVTE